MSKKIVFTGGGTAGHVTPNIALIQKLSQQGWQCEYIGSNQGIEKTLIEKINVPFYGIKSGKLRRYFSWQNFIDPFKILWGTIQSFFILGKIKPNLIFSKGGFVAFPVVFAAWLRRIPVIAHESDLTPGLATRLSYPFARHMCVTFDKAKNYFKKSDKVKVTGTPIRESLFQGDKNKGKLFCQFNNDKPCLLVVGGGLGSVAINKVVRAALPELLKTYNVIHLCGQGKVDQSLKYEGYKQFEYVYDEMPDLFALADLIISRSGANSVYEVLALAKPHIFIPLPLSASRGDQIQNANYFQELGISYVLKEEKLSEQILTEAVALVSQTKVSRTEKIKALNFSSGTDNILALVNNFAA